jgi:hypothetical protein
MACEVKKVAYFALYKIGLVNFESSWLGTFVLQKFEVFDIVLRNGAKNPLIFLIKKFSIFILKEVIKIGGSI